MPAVQPSESGARPLRGRITIGDTSVPPEAPCRDHGVLVRLDGPEAGNVINLRGRLVVFGRDPDADVTINEASVSRVHARIDHRGVSAVLDDLGSRNGTWVSAERVGGRRVLSDGDVVRFGPRASFRYALLDETEMELQLRLYRTSVTDPLTGAHNRRFCDERVQSELAFARRHGTALSLVLMDLDRFKLVNDTYGHPAGDAVLRHLAELVRAQIRAEDVFARYGGEEFVLLLRATDVIGAARVAERVRRSLAERPVPCGGGLELPVTLSAGCASLACCPAPTAEALVEVADRRLYAAKTSGRNRVMLVG